MTLTNRAVVVLLLVLLAAVPAHGGDSVFRTPYSPTLPEDDRVAGLSRIWSEATFGFVYFDRLPGLDWDALYLSYLPKVRAASSTTEYYKVLTRFVAQLKDGHTSVTPPAPVREQLFGEPALRLGEVEGHVVVTDVYDPALGIEHGTELVAVDRIPVRQFAAERVTPYQAASTPQDLAVRTWRQLLWGAEGSDVELTLVDARGRERRQVVRRLTAAEEEKITPVRAPFALRLLPGNVAYAALNEFADARAADAFDASFDAIAKADALILDLRLNGGGSSSIGHRVLADLTAKPFLTARSTTRLYNATARAWGEPEQVAVHEPEVVQPDGKRLFAKPVVVLTSAKTFSAAEDFAMAFDAMKRGTIIGEPTGGSTGQPLSFDLPGGGSARVCTKHDTYPDGKEFVGVGVQPQLLVRPSLADLRAGKDTVLEAAMAYLQSRR
jgi:carboxyl-terminal processing protease